MAKVSGRYYPGLAVFATDAIRPDQAGSPRGRRERPSAKPPPDAGSWPQCRSGAAPDRRLCLRPGRSRQTARPSRFVDPSAPMGGCRVWPSAGLTWSSDQCAPHPATTVRSACRRPPQRRSDPATRETFLKSSRACGSWAWWRGRADSLR